MQEVDYEKELLRAAHKKLALDFEPQLFLNLITNQQLSIDRLKLLIRRYLRDMDKQLLGKHKFLKVTPEKRIDGLFYIEHEHSNIHSHALINRPYCNRYGLQMHSERIWRNHCPSGSVIIKDVTDIEHLSEYCTKEYKLPKFFERQFFVAREMMAAA